MGVSIKPKYPFEDSYINSKPPENGNLMIEQRIKDLYRKDIEGLFSAFSSYANAKGVDAYINRLYDARLTVQELRDVITKSIDTLDKLPTVAQLKGLRHSISTKPDTSREEKDEIFKKEFLKEQEKSDKLKEDFIAMHPDKLNSYIKVWYEGVYEETISDLMPLGAFEKPALSDYFDAKCVVRDAIKIGKEKLLQP